MKVLVIPDVHLKPWMFQRASELMKEIKPDRTICLMDKFEKRGRRLDNVKRA